MAKADPALPSTPGPLLVTVAAGPLATLVLVHLQAPFLFKITHNLLIWFKCDEAIKEA